MKDPFAAFGYIIRVIFGGDVDSPEKEFAEFINVLLGGRPSFDVARPAGAGEIDRYATPPQGLISYPSASADPTYGLSTLYQFTGGVDGSGPRGALIPGPDGNEYGVTAFGGTGNQGTVYRLTPDGVLTTLHAFAGTGDGAVPQAGLVLASDGNFYGTTSGDSYDADTFSPIGGGTIFRVAPDGTFTTLHAFADDNTRADNPAEGKQSLAALLQASDGKLYGVTSAGGYFGNGAVFSITTDGVFAKVGDLAPQGLPGADGENQAFGRTPMAALIQGSDGNLYGTTTRGGTEGDGVIYKVDLNATASPTPTPTPNPAVPTVTVAVAGDGEAVEGGEAGKVKVVRTGDTSAALTVRYKVAGGVVAGKDYKALAGTVTIPAGATQAKVKIKTVNDSAHEGTRVAKVKLKAATDGSYTVGNPAAAKIKIIDND